MPKINYHGRAIKGLRKACSATHDEPRYSNWHYRIMFDRDTNELWVDSIYGRNTWTQYYDPAIIRIMDTTSHVKMQELADEVDWMLSLKELEDQRRREVFGEED